MLQSIVILRASTDCRLMSDLGRRTLWSSLTTSERCSSRKHTANLATEANSRLPVSTVE